MYDYNGLMAIVWTLWCLGFSTTLARFILRFQIQRSIRAEDYIALLGFIFLTGLAAVVTTSSPLFEMTREYLLDRAEDPLTPLPLPVDEFTARTVTALKLMFSQMLLFWSTLWAAKFSLLIFFRRLIEGIPKYLHIWWAVFTIVLLMYLACFLTNFLTCIPVTRYWSPTGCSAPSDLKRADVSIKFATAADVISDLLVMVLPLRLLFTLRISTKQKLGLAWLFSLGIIVVVFALLRLHNVTQATSQSQSNPTTMADGPLDLSLWSMIEAAVAVVVANLPAFRTILHTRGNTTRATTTGREDSFRYPVTVGSRNITTSRSTVKGQSIELESLPSFDDDIFFGKGPIQATDVEMNNSGQASKREDSMDSSSRGNQDPFTMQQDSKTELILG